MLCGYLDKAWCGKLVEWTYCCSFFWVEQICDCDCVQLACFWECDGPFGISSFLTGSHSKYYLNIAKWLSIYQYPLGCRGHVGILPKIDFWHIAPSTKFLNFPWFGPNLPFSMLILNYSCNFNIELGISYVFLHTKPPLFWVKNNDYTVPPWNFHFWLITCWPAGCVNSWLRLGLRRLRRQFFYYSYLQTWKKCPFFCPEQSMCRLFCT